MGDPMVPVLRFKDENGQDYPDWRKLSFENIFTRITKKNKINNQNVLTISAQKGLINQREYFNKSVSAKDITGYYLLEKGDYAYNKSYSKGYPLGAIKRLNLYKKGVVSTLYICFKIKDGFNTDFYEQLLDNGIINKEISKIAQEGARNHGLLNISVKEFFKDINVPNPSSNEQQKIAAFLSSVDKKIEQLTRKKELLEKYKTGMMQKLFPKAGEQHPELRFKDDDGQDFPDWRLSRIGKLIYKVGKKNKDNYSYPIYSINNKIGFIPQGDQFTGLDSQARGYDISMYKIVQPETFAYNPARINVGSIGYNKNLENIIISSLYVCFKTKFDINDQYLTHYFSTKEFNRMVLKHQEGGVRQYLFLDNFSDIQLAYPSLPEQQKIADFLSAIDDKITKVEGKLTKAQTFKKGLPQQMFV